MVHELITDGQGDTLNLAKTPVQKLKIPEMTTKPRQREIFEMGYAQDENEHKVMRK
jgi:hypothetical protein